MKIALIADPHVSLLDRMHGNLNLGDTARITEAVIDDVERRSPDLVIWMGDLTHEGTEAVRQRFAELHRRLRVSSVQFAGNHDVEYINKADFAQQTVPCARRQWWQMAGWDVVVLDTVQEFSSTDPNGVFSAADLRFVEDVAREAAGPMLVMGHHPLRPVCIDASLFWQAVAPLAGTGVYLGGHTHEDQYEIESTSGWHLLEIASCCCPPFGYHLAELSPDGLTMTPITVEVTGIDADAHESEGDAAPSVYPLHIAVDGVADEQGATEARSST